MYITIREQSGPIFQSLWVLGHCACSHTESKTHGMFIPEQLHFQVFWNFPPLFLLLILSYSYHGLRIEQTSYDFCYFNLLEHALYPRMWSILVYMPCELETMCILLLLKQSVDVYYIHFVNGGVEFSYVCADFLPAGSLHLGQRGV